MRIYHWALLIASVSPSMALGADVNNGKLYVREAASAIHP
jgi:hypothetical protein